MYCKKLQTLLRKNSRTNITNTSDHELPESQPVTSVYDADFLVVTDLTYNLTINERNLLAKVRNLAFHPVLTIVHSST